MLTTWFLPRVQETVSVIFLSATLLISVPLPTIADGTVDTDSSETNTSIPRVLRPMQVHKEADMGLEIWIENNPAWITAKRTVFGRPAFLAQSPLKAYPPASMSVSSFDKMISSEQDDFDEYVEIALKQGLLNYGETTERYDAITKEAKTYGILKGVEINFTAIVHEAKADVKIFIGRGENKGPVLLQLFTIAGSMKHLNEHVRRSWGNIKYL